MSNEKFKELDTDIQLFLTELVNVARETFPGRDGLVRFHEGLKALDGVFEEVREAEGF